MLANPPEAGVASQRLFEHRGAVDAGTSAIVAGDGSDAVGQRCEPRTQYLVIVAPQCIARYIAQHRVAKNALGRGGCGGEIVHSRGNDPQGARNEFSGPCTLQPMPVHVPHLAVTTACEP